MDELVWLTGKHKPLTVVNYGDLGEFKKDLTIVENYLLWADVSVFGLDKDADEGLINTIGKLAREENKMMIVTLGKYGSIAYQKDNVFIQPAKEVAYRDTTGAGDSFLSAFVVTFLHTGNIQQSLAKGTTLASRVIQNVGAY